VIIRAALAEATIDNTLSLGHDGSIGKNASPHLKIEKTEIMYSTEGGIYIPTIFGLYALAVSA
jgi:hypothetical protein